jgi:hypothetical protein
MSEHAGGEPVGTLEEEATKFLRALQGWAGDGGGEPDATQSGPAGSSAGSSDGSSAGSSAWASAAASAAQHVEAHLATGGADCRYCPVCRVISAVRGTSPEVRHHLKTAATSLVQAAAGALATTVPDRREDPSPGPSGAAGGAGDPADGTGDETTDRTGDQTGDQGEDH